MIPNRKSNGYGGHAFISTVHFKTGAWWNRNDFQRHSPQGRWNSRCIIAGNQAQSRGNSEREHLKCDLRLLAWFKIGKTQIPVADADFVIVQKIYSEGCKRNALARNILDQDRRLKAQLPVVSAHLHKSAERKFNCRRSTVRPEHHDRRFGLVLLVFSQNAWRVADQESDDDQGEG